MIDGNSEIPEISTQKEGGSEHSQEYIDPSDYTQAITAVEFSQFSIRYDDEEDKVSDSNTASLLATSHVNGSVKVYKFNSYQ